MKILLVGLESKLAHESVTWSSLQNKIPTFGEYQHVIFYLPTLDKTTFSEYNSETVEAIKSQISKALLRTESQLYCITAPEIGNYTDDATNYSIFPFALKVSNNESGKELEPKPNNSYFARVKSWDFCISGIKKSTVQTGSYSIKAWQLEGISLTKTLEYVAFTVGLVEKNLRGQILKTITKAVLFVPPISSEKDDEAISSFISSYITPDEYTLPDFVEDIGVPGEVELNQKIEELQQIILASTEKLETEKAERNKLNFMKGIVGLRDKPLQRAVVRVFENMGLSLDGKETYEEDKTFTYEENLIPVEIKGHKGAVTRQDVLQVMSRNEKAKVKDENYVKGILIANPYNETPLDERGIDFEPNIVKSVAGWNICLLSTRVLLQYWIDFRKTGKTNLGERLLTTPGVLEYKSSQTSKEKTNS